MIPTENGYPRQFEINISQPSDHSNPSGTRFNRRFFLSHRGKNIPVAFITGAYLTRAGTVAEVRERTDANRIYVGHRFMGCFRSAIKEWDYLTVEQAAADSPLEWRSV